MADHPSPGRLAAGLAALVAVAGAGVLVAAELSPLLHVRVATAVVARIGTGPHHSYAQLVIAGAVVLMAGAHAASRRRAPLVALVALAVISLLITLTGDLPDTRATGVYGVRFEDAKATAQNGLWLELIGGATLLLGAATGLVLAPRRREGARAGGALAADYQR